MPPPISPGEQGIIDQLTAINANVDRIADALEQSAATFQQIRQTSLSENVGTAIQDIAKLCNRIREGSVLRGV